MTIYSSIINPDARSFSPCATPMINAAESLNKKGSWMAFGPARIVSVMSAGAFCADQFLNATYGIFKGLGALTLRALELGYAGVTGKEINLNQKLGLTNWTAEQAGVHAMRIFGNFAGEAAAIASIANPIIVVQASRSLHIAQKPEVKQGWFKRTVNATVDASKTAGKAIRSRPKTATAVALTTLAAGAGLYTGHTQTAVKTLVSPLLRLFSSKPLQCGLNDKPLESVAKKALKQEGVSSMYGPQYQEYNGRYIAIPTHKLK